MASIISYNVNGIRAAEKKGLADWWRKMDPDVLCFQEIKANVEDIPEVFREPENHHSYWYSAQKKGYSGVGIISKKKPLHVEYGCGIKAYDDEGRIIRADFKGYSVMCVYIPSGSSGEIRQGIKDKFLIDFIAYVKELKKEIPNLIICGDYNICHKAIDIHNPVSNKKSSGFLEHEREWVTEFLDAGFVDTFRHFNPDPDHYTWWSFRMNARARNLGWRIDYHMVTQELIKKCKAHIIHNKVIHSDHCPIELVLK